MAGNRLIRSASSLSETNGITPEPKASMSRIRRLSEPKTINHQFSCNHNESSTYEEAVLKRKLPELSIQVRLQLST